MTAKRYKLRISSLILALVCLLGVGTIGIQASPTCQRVVRKYVERIAAPHHFSKTTLDRWAAWNKIHPNYHPPKRRPSLTPQETADNVNFACAVEPAPVFSNALLQKDPPPSLAVPLHLVTTETVPPPTPTMVSLVNAPVTPPVIDSSPVPEPSSWLFLATGAMFLVACMRPWKKQALRAALSV